jgi:hypothetical protein
MHMYYMPMTVKADLVKNYINFFYNLIKNIKDLKSFYYYKLHFNLKL